MKTLVMTAIAALLVSGAAFGLSTITYTLEVGGDNHAADWEGELNPVFTSPAWGSASPPNPFDASAGLVTWDAIIEVTGVHSGDGSADGKETNGIANFVFDLAVYAMVGGTYEAPVLDAAPVAVAGIYESTINDGDLGPGDINDPLEAAAFCLGFAIDYAPQQTPPTPSGDNLLDGSRYGNASVLGSGGPPIGPGRVFDKGNAGGPHLDRAQFPTTDDQAGGWMGDDAYTQNLGTPNAGLEGQLKGMGAGYSAYSSVLIGSLATDDAGGLGIALLDANAGYLAYNGVTGVYRSLGVRPVAEGQMDLLNLPGDGDYCLVLTADVEGHNVIPGDYDVQYTSGGAFAIQANEVVADFVCFGVVNTEAPVEPEACCTEGVCSVVLPSECTGGGGTPQGPGTDCDPNPCIVPGVTPIVGGWVSERTHGLAGPLDIVLDPAATGTAVVSDSRVGVAPANGIVKIVVTFDGAPALVDGTVDAQRIAPAGAPIAGAAVVNGNDLEITFSPALPNQTCFKIDLTAELSNLDGAADPDCLFRSLAGNANNDNNTNLIDYAQVKAKDGQSPAAPGNARFDINVDGSINLIDYAQTKGLDGGASACP